MGRWTVDDAARIMEVESVVPGFGTTMRDYQREVLGLGLNLMSLLGEAMDPELSSGQDHQTLRKSCEAAVCHHRVLHYPPLQSHDYQQGNVSIGAHVDYGFLTILQQDLVGGLQVLDFSKNRWIHVPPQKHGYVVNFGSMLAEWTGNRIKATVHRVLNLSGRERYSSPFFLRPALSTVLDPRAFGEGGNESDDGSGAPPLTCEQILTNFYRQTGQAKT